jgi:hypothetical protein
MESANEKYHEEGMKESNPGDIRRNDAAKPDPARANTESGRPEIDESGSGREASQQPVEEHESDFSQIDPESAHAASMEKTRAKEFDTDDFKRVDERDDQDSSEDWDAEKSRTGRHR